VTSTTCTMAFAAVTSPSACAAAQSSRRAAPSRVVASAHGTSSSFVKLKNGPRSSPVDGRLGSRTSRARGDASAASVASGSAFLTPSARVTAPQPALVEEKFWEWEGHTIRYTQSGTSGPAILLVHGFGGNADHWRKNTPVLGRTARVFAIDLLGYGYSSKPNPMEKEPNAIYNFENWSRQLLKFTEEIIREPAFVACNSVGGVAGLQAAVDDASLVRGVVLINISLRGLHVSKQPAFAKPFIRAFQTALRTTNLGRSFFGTVAKRETVRSVLKEAYGDPNAVTEELVDCILKPGLEPGAAEVFLDFISYSGGPLPEDLLPKIDGTVTPIRILWGRADPWEIVAEGRKYGEFECVDRFVELPGVGHCPMDEAPDLINPLLMEFVNDYGGARGGAK